MINRRNGLFMNSQQRPRASIEPLIIHDVTSLADRRADIGFQRRARDFVAVISDLSAGITQSAINIYRHINYKNVGEETSRWLWPTSGDGKSADWKVSPQRDRRRAHKGPRNFALLPRLPAKLYFPAGICGQFPANRFGGLSGISFTHT